MFGLMWNWSKSCVVTLNACQWDFKTPPCQLAQIVTIIAISQFKHVRCRKKPNNFHAIDVLKLWADNNDNKTQVFVCGLCQRTYAAVLEIFGKMLKRHRLNCCIKHFTEITKHWCFERNSWSKHQCFNKHKLWHLCLIHIWF